jgi:hypothetical protein
LTCVYRKVEIGTRHSTSKLATIVSGRIVRRTMLSRSRTSAVIHVTGNR